MHGHEVRSLTTGSVSTYRVRSGRAANPRPVLRIPLLETKFNVPGIRRRLVERPRLLERLGSSTLARLTLVSAPAGFGKSTLIASWLTEAAGSGDRRVAISW